MFDPIAIAAAHRAAITALEAAGEVRHAEVLRVQGTELIRLARIGQAQHERQGRDTETVVKPTTDITTRNARGHG